MNWGVGVNAGVSCTVSWDSHRPGPVRLGTEVRLLPVLCHRQSL